jgi:hypothetical protein
MPSLDVQVMARTLRDEDDQMIQGLVHFSSTPSKDLVKHLLDNKLQIPTVFCSRKGDSCATPITELQGHNGHVPVFDVSKEQTEDQLIEYTKRILVDVISACASIDVQMSLSKSDKDSIYADQNKKTHQSLEIQGVEACEQCNAVDHTVKWHKTDLDEGLKCQACIDNAEALGEMMVEEEEQDNE